MILSDYLCPRSVRLRACAATPPPRNARACYTAPGPACDSAPAPACAAPACVSAPATLGLRRARAPLCACNSAPAPPPPARDCVPPPRRPVTLGLCRAGARLCACASLRLCACDSALACVAPACDSAPAPACAAPARDSSPATLRLPRPAPRRPATLRLRRPAPRQPATLGRRRAGVRLCPAPASDSAPASRWPATLGLRRSVPLRGRSCIVFIADSESITRAELCSPLRRPGGYREGGAAFSSAQDCRTAVTHCLAKHLAKEEMLLKLTVPDKLDVSQVPGCHVPDCFPSEFFGERQQSPNPDTLLKAQHLG
ncbi:uncharacterized protein [Chlorocebus sabaeus]|uniref:uncharacterized protein n=1 Tax=Chlorocebus sabaeus TaxID=60711 RepID=UPI003BF98248